MGILDEIGSEDTITASCWSCLVTDATPGLGTIHQRRTENLNEPIDGNTRFVASKEGIGDEGYPCVRSVSKDKRDVERSVGEVSDFKRGHTRILYDTGDTWITSRDARHVEDRDKGFIRECEMG